MRSSFLKKMALVVGGAFLSMTLWAGQPAEKKSSPIAHPDFDWKTTKNKPKNKDPQKEDARKAKPKHFEPESF
ncbi:MAG: hypothetical protein ACOYKA_07125 [Legionellaceae bacterium]